jgi:hypothetical protein
MRAGCQKVMRLAPELTGKGLQRTYEVLSEGVTNRLICRPATSVLSLMSPDHPVDLWRTFHPTFGQWVRTYIYDSCPLRADAANPAQSTE